MIPLRDSHPARIFPFYVFCRLGFLLFPIFYLASGAIAGVLGAYFALFGHHKIKTLVPVFGFLTVVGIPASVMLFYWFITQLFSEAASSDTSSLEG